MWSRICRVAGVSWPLLAGSITALLTTVADSAVLGQYDTQELAVMAQASVIYVFCTALLIPLGTAVQIVGAQWFGAKDHDRTKRLLRHSGIMAAGCGILLTVVLLVAAPWVTLITSAGSGDRGQVVQVVRVLALSVPLVALSAAMRGWLGGQGRTKIAIIYAAVVNISNVGLSIWAVYGFDLGAIGVAWGTLVANILGTVVCLLLVDHRRRRLEQAEVAQGESVARPLMKVAWPDIVFGATAYGADVLVISAVALMGAVELSGYRISASTTAILFTIAFTCGSGVSILVGQCKGAGDFRGGLAYARAGSVFMAFCVAVFALPVLVTPQWYIRIFTTDAEVTATVLDVLRLYWVIAPVMVVGLSMAAVIRAVGDTKSMMYIGLGSQALVALPLAWVLGIALNGGLVGVVAALAAGWVVRAILTAWRLQGTIAQQLAIAEEGSRQTVT